MNEMYSEDDKKRHEQFRVADALRYGLPAEATWDDIHMHVLDAFGEKILMILDQSPEAKKLYQLEYDLEKIYKDIARTNVLPVNFSRKQIHESVSTKLYNKLFDINQMLGTAHAMALEKDPDGWRKHAAVFRGLPETATWADIYRDMGKEQMMHDMEHGVTRRSDMWEEWKGCDDEFVDV